MLEKPANAMAIRPAVTNAIGVPLKHTGVSASATRSRTNEKMTIASVKPIAEPKLNTTDGMNVYSF